MWSTITMNIFEIELVLMVLVYAVYQISRVVIERKRIKKIAKEYNKLFKDGCLGGVE